MLIENGVVYSPYVDQDVEGKSFSQVVLPFLHKYGERLCLVNSFRPEQGVNYSQLLWMVEKAAGFLQFRGVRPHSRVLLNAHNSIETIVAYLAVAFCNAVAVNSKPSANMRELKYIVKDCECSFVITEKDRVEMLRAIQDDVVDQIEEILIVADSSDNIEWSADDNVKSIQQVLLANEEHRFNYTEVVNPKEHTLLICYTSGSTGLPKGVELTHTNLIASMLGNGYPDGSRFMHEDDVVLLWNPLSHISGVGVLCAFITTGAIGIVADSVRDFNRFVELVEKFSISVLVAFPTALHQLSRLSESADISSLRLKELRIGTENMFRTNGFFLCILLVETYTLSLKTRMFTGVQETYGLSETMGAITATVEDHVEPYSVGHPIANCRMKVVDMDTGENLGPHQPGEILCKGPVIMKGYLNRPQATAEAFDEDGWLLTGDYGYYDEDGEFYVIERLKQLIKCMDNQVNPSELEELLLTHESVKETIVIGIPNETVGEAPTAFVVLNDGYEGNPTLQEVLKDVVASQTSHYKHLYGGLKFIDQLPKTDSGKFNRSEMKKIYMASLKSIG
ncbi:acyl-CoA synthetase-like [Tropilaelaps mercedesae]|uniref:Acyl-CoA synthetase-like n=1 Tax=Tropilaelaps mercedesae TaxID=418985 RepID=A0A1V9XZT9_9ACAR|nr:acyl-CoA synthetase-like [Tropilaelaps mercedesae]